ncbi:MAG: hypothetical protein WCR52_09515 [Bacteroidota bacterium]|jgi:hypothetical protein
MSYFIETLKLRSEPLFYYGLICLIAAGICLLAAQFTQTQVAGANAWYKPFKFLLSSTIFVWSMAWYIGYLPKGNDLVAYAWGMILLLSFENIYIMLQAAKGQLSHFNTSSSFHAGMFSAMGIAAVLIALWTAVLGIRFFTETFPDLPNYYIWSIRLGIVIFALFALEGLAMGARLAHTVGAPDGGAGVPVLNWSKSHGDLRIAHFLGMHALQILPLLSWYLVRELSWTVIVALLYGAFTLLTMLQALNGKPLVRF